MKCDSLKYKIKVSTVIDEKLMPKFEISETFNRPKRTLFTIIKNYHSILRTNETVALLDREKRNFSS